MTAQNQVNFRMSSTVAALTLANKKTIPPMGRVDSTDGKRKISRQDDQKSADGKSRFHWWDKLWANYKIQR